jgi:hypothetical protein
MNARKSHRCTIWEDLATEEEQTDLCGGWKGASLEGRALTSQVDRRSIIQDQEASLGKSQSILNPSEQKPG